MNLNAIDTDELKIISTILQDGLIEVNDIKYLPSIRSFFLMITRFMWEEKIVNKVDQRIKAVLSFEDVLSVYSKNIDQLNKKINFQEKDFNESQLDYFYLTSPSMIEKRIKNLDINRYLPMEYSKIFLSMSSFLDLQNKLVIQRNQNEIKKK